MTRPKQSPRRCGRQARHPDSLVTASTPVRLRQRIHDDFSRVNAAYEVAPPPPPPPPSAIYMCMRALRHHLRDQHSPPPLSATHPRRVHGAAPTLTGVAQQRGAAADAAPLGRAICIARVRRAIAVVNSVLASSSWNPLDSPAPSDLSSKRRSGEVKAQSEAESHRLFGAW